MLLLEILFVTCECLGSLVTGRDVCTTPFTTDYAVFVLGAVMSRVLVCPCCLLLFVTFVSFMICSSSGAWYM